MARARALAALGVVALLLLLAWREGGFAAQDWGPAAVALLLLLGLALGVGVAGPAGRLETAMLAAGGLFCAWSFMSIAWASFPGDALAGSGKTILSFAAFALLALLGRSRRRLALRAFGFGIAAIAAVVLLRAAVSNDPGQFFVASRLVDPVGYENGDVCLWMLGACALLLPGTSGRSGPILRGATLAGIVLLLDMCVLSQSRAWFYLLPLTALVAVALSRERWQTGTAIGACALAAGAASPVVARVYDGGVTSASMRNATVAAAVAALGGAAFGVAWALAQARLPPLRANLKRTAGVILVAGALVGAVIAVAAAPRLAHPVGLAQSAWSDFKTPYLPSDSHRSRFTASVSSDRWREWSIAFRAFVRHPVAGIGADNYEAVYLRERGDALYDPRYPHSTPLRLLSQLGLVGTAIFLVFGVCAFWGALRARGAADPDVALAAQGGLLVFLYWLAHSSFDWFWEIPALAAPAFAFLGLAAAGVAGRPLAPKRVRLVVGVLVAAAAMLVVPPWLENVLVVHGASVSAGSVADANRDFRWAAKIDPVSAEPYLYLGSLALNRGELTAAKTAFRSAERREPENWYAWLQLAVTDVQAHRFAEAAQEVQAARRLNPKDPVTALADRFVSRKIVFSPALLNTLYVSALNRRFGTGP
ncbi:MAG: O-antigen ligase family protein [Gaiellaceae bacterium]